MNEDELKTSFITPNGTYCYLWMPEGHKNTGRSFNRMIAKVLRKQLGRNVLTYVDGIIVRSTKQQSHILDLQEIFTNFQRACLKLNPENCVFGMKKGKTSWLPCVKKGIEANPKVSKKAHFLELVYLKIYKMKLTILVVLKSVEVFQWDYLNNKPSMN
jgi:hypothetical protein